MAKVGVSMKRDQDSGVEMFVFLVVLAMACVLLVAVVTTALLSRLWRRIKYGPSTPPTTNVVRFPGGVTATNAAVHSRWRK